ncbi:hypothetical protein NQ317_018625 [Molorchus minor]|uniref:NF-X1-type domain-containing protein n=1 Tax=Molorchus minor TaxID=1323400 RepID=A0ABQ9IRQ6_9CUCU|nr:hypothetical protein NQ317_018625 [Molorchus minor]
MEILLIKSVACQNVCTEVPKQYKCYCGKALDPKYDPGVRPHGCGDVCLRKGRMCEHKCTILCHPGPCPDCSVMVEKPCGCGSAEANICNKILNCGIHQCKSVCHSGNCTPCREAIIQECYCNKQGRKVICSAEISGSLRYSCEDICEKILSCGNHKCQEKCHDGPCDPCARDVSVVHSCPCGKTPLEKARASCRDPIPCCDKVLVLIVLCSVKSGVTDITSNGQPFHVIQETFSCGLPCGKQMPCGRHKCNKPCHDGPCQTPCRQPCNIPRDLCGHPCDKCHDHLPRKQL